MSGHITLLKAPHKNLSASQNKTGLVIIDDNQTCFTHVRLKNSYLPFFPAFAARALNFSRRPAVSITFSCPV